MKKRFLSLLTAFALAITSGLSNGAVLCAQEATGLGWEDNRSGETVGTELQSAGAETILSGSEDEISPLGDGDGNDETQIAKAVVAETEGQNAGQSAEENMTDIQAQEEALGDTAQIIEDEISETEIVAAEETTGDTIQNADEIIIDLSTEYTLSEDEEEEDIGGIAAASEDIISGTCGESAYYELNLSTGVLRIYGSGRMSDFDVVVEDETQGSAYISLPPWKDYAEYITSVVVEDGITYIGKSACCGQCRYDENIKYTNLESVKIDSTVTEIGEDAFDSCEKLADIEWGASLVGIGKNAFRESAITELAIPDTVEEIGYGSFRYCVDLKRVTIPDKCHIGPFAFSQDTALEEAYIGENCIIGYLAFSKCSALQTISLGEGCAEPITGDEGQSFNDCTSLRSVLLPDSWGDSISGAFQGCVQLSDIQFKDSNQKYKNVDGVVYTKDEKKVVYYPEGLTAEEYSIPEGVTEIGSGAFGGQTYLDYVEIPDSVTIINTGAFMDSNLRCLILPDSVTEIGERSLRIKDAAQKQIVISPNITEISLGKAWGWAPFAHDIQTIWGKAGSYIDDFCEEYGVPFKERIEVSFDPAGGSVSKEYKVVLPNEPYYTLPTPEREGYIFDGWYTAADGGSKVTRDTVVSEEVSHTLYAHWRSEKPVPDLASLTYRFSNSYSGFGYPNGYHIPLSIFQIIFGKTTLAKMMYLRNGEWGGSCYGMAASSGAFNVFGSGMDIKDFNTGADRVYDLKTDDVNAALSLNLRQYIEAIHISQLTDLIQSDYQENRNSLTELCELSASVEDGTEPVIIAIFGPQGGHALLGYKLEDIDKTTSKLYVYDCNYPDTERYITITKNAAGQYAKWYYYLNDMYHWGTDYKNCWISYVPYESYLSAWTTRKGENATNILCVNSSNVSIRNYQGDEVAKIVDGQLVTSDSNIYEIMDMSVSADGINIDRPKMLYLPTDVYTIENEDSSLTNFEVSMANTDLGATVSTVSDVVTFAVDDDSNLNAVDIESGKGEAYEIELNSTTGDGYGTVQLAGEGNGSTVSISLTDGQINLNNCKNARLTADGTAVDYVTVEAVAGDGGSISPSGICNYVTGRSQTFAIKADDGYEIKDVEIDNRSIGKVTFYTFEDLKEDHVIKVVFEKQHSHSWSEWKVTKDATVFDMGERTRTCSICATKDIDPIGKLEPSMTLNVSSIPLKSGQSTKKVKVSDLARGDYVVSWQSSNKKIVKVNGKGKITAQKKTGKAKITVMLKSGLSGTITVKVQKKAVSCKKISLNKSSVILDKGGTFRLRPELKPITCVQKIKYASSDKKVATVSAKGVIKAKKKGIATITVKVGKKKAKCKVTVK